VLRRYVLIFETTLLVTDHYQEILKGCFSADSVVMWPSVCHKPVLCRNNWTKIAGFGMEASFHPGVKVGRCRDTGTRRYGVPADAISLPADSAAAVVKFTISIPRESCINAKAKYGSSVVPPDPSVHFYHCFHLFHTVLEGNLGISKH